jgi:hypothetical protein
MIAPCKCKGGSKWVHRDCLNLWRAQEKDRAFAQCTECLFHYYYIKPAPTATCRQSRRRMKFCLFVSRDICIVTVAVQLIIGFMGWIVMLIDDGAQMGLLDFFDGNSCDNSVSRSFWCNHELAFYYIVGLIFFLAVLGVIGSIVGCHNGCTVPDLGPVEQVGTTGQEDPACAERRSEFYRRSRQRQVARDRQQDRSSCCDGCCGGPHCYPSYGGPITNGDCCCRCCDLSNNGCPSAHSHSGGSDGGDGQHILLMIFLVVVIVMAVIGFLVGVFLGVVLVQRVVQRHISILQKKRMAEEFQVADLARYDLSGDFDPETLQGSESLAEPLPSPLHPDDAAHLRKLGLL